MVLIVRSTWRNDSKHKQINKKKNNLLECCPSLEAKRSSATQEISRILWNPKVNCRIHKSPPPVPVMRQISLVYVPSQIPFLKTQCNVIFLSTTGSSKWSLSFISPTKTLFASLLSSIRAPPISLFLVWLPEWYLVKSTDHKAPRYVVFSTPLLPRPS